MPLATREGRPFLRINGISVQGEEITDLGPELPELRELGVDILRLYPQETGMADVGGHFDLARRSPTPPPRLGFRNGYWHGEQGRSAESRVGKEGGGTLRYRGTPLHAK